VNVVKKHTLLAQTVTTKVNEKLSKKRRTKMGYELEWDLDTEILFI
jgi:hypothetical protein